MRQEERTSCVLCFWATTRTTSSPDLCSCSKAAEEDRHFYKHLPRHRRHRLCPQQHHHPDQGVQLWRGGPWCILLGRQARAAVKVRRGKFKRFLTLLIFWIFSLQGSDALPIWGEALQLQGQDHPHTWKVIVYTSKKRINILLICNSRFNGKKDVVLHLPPGSTVDQLKYEIQYLSNWFQSSKSSTYLRILIVWTLTLYFFQMDLCLVSRLHSQLWPCECAIKLFYLVSRTCC